MGPSRLLFIDESLSKRLAAVLKHRGRAAVSSSELNLLELKDEPLLREVYKDGQDVVFVTADDDLPAEHAGVLKEVGATVATVAPFERGKWVCHPGILSDEEAWKREIVSRWAHAMQEQPKRTHKRYYLNGGRRWRPRKKSVV
ncbi:MAG TPA: hypothetical protein VGB06_08935 [Solirubrobacterales bacterium]|jgi:hypothetical protein